MNDTTEAIIEALEALSKGGTIKENVFGVSDNGSERETKWSTPVFFQLSNSN
jgi:hypothetical protein